MQLSILGYVLAPLFHFNTWWLVLIYAAAMVAVSSAETVSCPSASYKVDSTPPAALVNTTPLGIEWATIT